MKVRTLTGFLILACACDSFAQDNFVIEPPPSGKVIIGPNAMPADTGNSGDLLTTDGAGNISFKSIDEITVSDFESNGCSATQQDNSVLIECADGSSGVIAGAGTVVAYPSGEVGTTPELTLSTGEIVAVDATDTVLGKVLFVPPNTEGTYEIELFPSGDSRRAVLFNEPTLEAVNLTSSSSADFVYFLEEECNGDAFQRSVSAAVELPNGKLYVVPQEGGISTELLFSSVLRLSSGACTNGEYVHTASLLVEFSPPSEIRRAVYPARLMQLP